LLINSRVNPPLFTAQDEIHILVPLTDTDDHYTSGKCNKIDFRTINFARILNIFGYYAPEIRYVKAELKDL